MAPPRVPRLPLRSPHNYTHAAHPSKLSPVGTHVPWRRFSRHTAGTQLITHENPSIIHPVPHAHSIARIFRPGREHTPLPSRRPDAPRAPHPEGAARPRSDPAVGEGVHEDVLAAHRHDLVHDAGHLLLFDQRLHGHPVAALERRDRGRLLARRDLDRTL